MVISRLPVYHVGYVTTREGWFLDLPQLPHPQHPEQRQSFPGVDPPFIGGAEQVGRPGYAQDFGPAFDAIELFYGEAAGGGETLYGGIGIGVVAGGKGISFGPAANAVDEWMEAVRA